MNGPRSLPSEIEAAAQDQVQEIVGKLEEIDRSLRAIHQSLATPAKEETIQDLEEEPDISTEIRSIIECVLADSLGPAIRDLRAAFLYRVGSRLK